MEENTKMPRQLAGKWVVKNAWKACVSHAKARKGNSILVSKDKDRMAGFCEESKRRVLEDISTPLQKLAENLYCYLRMRHEIGVASRSPGAFAADIRLWETIVLTGVHPDTRIYARN